MELLERFLNRGIPVVIMAENLADSLALADREEESTTSEEIVENLPDPEQDEMEAPEQDSTEEP